MRGYLERWCLGDDTVETILFCVIQEALWKDNNNNNIMLILTIVRV